MVKTNAHGRIARCCRTASPRLALGLGLRHYPRKTHECLKSIVKNSIGPDASSSSKPERSPAKPMAPSSRPMAKPRFLPLSSRPRQPRPGGDFFPLTVNYQEKSLRGGAAFPVAISSARGGRRKRRPSSSRLIDRPIRPLFPDGYRNETQVVATVLSHDLENDPDIVAVVASSAALTLSGVPVHGAGRAPRGSASSMAR